MSEKRGNSPASSNSLYLKVGEWMRRGRLSGSFASNTTPETPSLGDLNGQTAASPVNSLVLPHASENRQTGKETPHAKQKGAKAQADSHDSHQGRRTLLSSYTMPPASWSKWSFYNRAERAAGAGPDDKVKPRDFAVAASLGDGRIFWVTDKTPAEKEPIARSFSRRLVHGVKSGFENLLAPKTASAGRVKIPAKVKRRYRSSGQLEYPELEIMATEGGYRELKALERAIESMKTGQPAERPGSSDVAGGAGDKAFGTPSRETPSTPAASDMVEENRTRGEAIHTLRPTAGRNGDGPATLVYSVTRHYRESMMSRDTPVSTDHFETPPSPMSLNPPPRSQPANTIRKLRLG